eukprot:6212721-Pleurochrysis_carterae.AAC.1
MTWRDIVPEPFRVLHISGVLHRRFLCAQRFRANDSCALWQLDAEGSVSKLHLTVQPDKTAQSSNVLPSRRARCLPASQRFEQQTAAAASGARLLRCTNFSQSQGYVVNYKRARWVVRP